MIDVPNSLRAKALGNFKQEAFRRELKATMGLINLEKMDRHAHRLADGAVQLADDYAAGERALDDGRLDRLQVSATELKWRVRDDGLISVSELCDAIHNVLAHMRHPERNVLTKEVSILKLLALAIRGALTPEYEKTAVIHDIAETVYSRG